MLSVRFHPETFDCTRVFLFLSDECFRFKQSIVRECFSFLASAFGSFPSRNIDCTRVFLFLSDECFRFKQSIVRECFNFLVSAFGSFPSRNSRFHRSAFRSRTVDCTTVLISSKAVDSLIADFDRFLLSIPCVVLLSCFHPETSDCAYSWVFAATK